MQMQNQPNQKPFNPEDYMWQSLEGLTEQQRIEVRRLELRDEYRSGLDYGPDDDYCSGEE